MSRSRVLIFLALFSVCVAVVTALLVGDGDPERPPAEGTARTDSTAAPETDESVTTASDRPVFLGTGVKGWAERLLSPTAKVVRDAQQQLRQGGADAVATLAVLVRHGDPELRDIAGDLLVRIGEPAVATLVDLSRDREAQLRFQAVSSLGDMAPDGAPVLEALIARLDDDEVRVVSEATWAIAALRERAGPAAAALVKALRHEEPLVRIYAAGALAGIEPAAKSTVIALTSSLADADAVVRRCAAEALAAFGVDAAVAVSALTVALGDRNVYVRNCAAGALGSIGPAARGAVESLRRSLGDVSVAAEAAWAIERITGEKVDVSGVGTNVEVTVEMPGGPLSADQWPMLGRTGHRNSVSPATGLRSTWDAVSGDGVLWFTRLGDTTYGSPVLAGDLIFVGTDNFAPRDPTFSEDGGVLMAIRARDGGFVWQDVAPDLGRGLEDFLVPVTASSPLVEGDRLFYVTSQCQLRCLDVAGFTDGENDGPVRDEERSSLRDADRIWEIDLGAQLGVFPHESSNCSIVAAGNLLMVCTSNGVDEAHTNVPSPRAPSFIGVDKRDGRVVWRAKGPGKNILHGQWSSPVVAVVNGRVLAMFGGGDGKLYGMDAATGQQIWTYDGNPEDAVWKPSGDVEGIVSRNSIVACPVYHEGLVYLTMGQDPEHGEGRGCVHAIDPRGSGDVTRSRAVWKCEDVGRSITTPVIADGLMYFADYNGFLHCLDIRNGDLLWSHDLFAGVWGCLLVADGRVYVGTEDGTITVLATGREKKVLSTIDMDSAVYCTPVAVGGVLYIATSRYLWAIGEKGQSESGG